MKKKLIITMLALFSASALVHAFQFSLLPLGYMNHMVRTRYTAAELPSGIVNGIGSVAGGSSSQNEPYEIQQGYNAYTAGVDFYVAHLYAGIRVGLPTTMIKTGTDPMQSYYKTLSNSGIQKVKSYIVDSQLGFYGAFNRGKFTTIFGLGGALNYISVEQQLNKSIVSGDIQLKNPSFMNETLKAGIGANLSVSFRFVSFAAITLTVTDSVIFYPITEIRYLKGTSNYGEVIRTPATKLASHKIQLGNNFTASLGVSFGIF